MGSHGSPPGAQCTMLTHGLVHYFEAHFGEPFLECLIFFWFLLFFILLLLLFFLVLFLLFFVALFLLFFL